MPFNLVDMHESFEGTCYLHRQGIFRMEAAGSSEMLLQINQNIQRHSQENNSLHNWIQQMVWYYELNICNYHFLAQILS
jgi:hypothetical protein